MLFDNPVDKIERFPVCDKPDRHRSRCGVLRHGHHVRSIGLFCDWITKGPIRLAGDGCCVRHASTSPVAAAHRRRASRRCTSTIGIGQKEVLASSSSRRRLGGLRTGIEDVLSSRRNQDRFNGRLVDTLVKLAREVDRRSRRQLKRRSSVCCGFPPTFQFVATGRLIACERCLSLCCLEAGRWPSPGGRTARMPAIRFRLASSLPAARSNRCAAYRSACRRAASLDD